MSAQPSNDSGRRRFLQAAAAGATGAVLGGTSLASRSAADRIVLGIIGPGGMGMNHLTQLCQRNDVAIAAVCDVDEQRLLAAGSHVSEKTGKKPDADRDLRRMLDDPSIDAVFIATPDHWHAPATVLAAKAWNSQKRGDIGKSKPSPAPAHLDFDTWVGPAPMVSYRPNLLPGRWPWWYDFGCGDIGNDGVHDIDVAVWGLNVTSHPERMTCLGGKYFFDDDQQFPDTQYAICEYPVAASSRTGWT